MIINGAIGIGMGWNARAQFYSENRAPGKDRSDRRWRRGDPRHRHHQSGRRRAQSGGRQGLHRLRPVPGAAGALGEADVLRPDNRNATTAGLTCWRAPPRRPETLAKMMPVDWDYVASVLDRWADRWRREVIPRAVERVRRAHYLTLQGVSKSYGAAAVVAGSISASGPRRVRHAARPLGLRQDDRRCA